jgi:hypothetical protein
MIHSFFSLLHACLFLPNCTNRVGTTTARLPADIARPFTPPIPMVVGGSNRNLLRLLRFGSATKRR